MLKNVIWARKKSLNHFTNTGIQAPRLQVFYNLHDLLFYDFFNHSRCIHESRFHFKTELYLELTAT